MLSDPSEPARQDCVFIRGLSVQAVLGILEHERTQPQTVLLSVELFTDPRQPEAPDSIDVCVDYSHLAERLSEHIRSARRYTVEALAEDLAEICLTYMGVNRVRLRVEKPQAIAAAASVGVEINRSKRSAE